MFDRRISVHTIALTSDDLATGVQSLTRAGVPALGYLSARLPGPEATAAISHLTTPPMFTLEDPAAWPGQRRALQELLRTAADRGAEVVYGITGPAGSLSWEQAATAFTRAVEPVVALSREFDVPLLVEITNQLRQELNFVYTLRDLVTLADLSGVGICCDLMWCWREPGIEALIAQTARRTGLVQVSDYVPGMASMPDRAVPGDGIIPLVQLIGAYLQAGYPGRFDIELLGPRIDAEGPLAACLRAAEAVTGMLRSAAVTAGESR